MELQGAAWQGHWEATLGSALALLAFATFGAAAALHLRRCRARLAESERLAVLGQAAASAAHELKSPLQVMLGYLTLHRDLADPRLAAHLAAIEEEARRCEGVVEGMLELSRPRPNAATPVELRELCEDVTARLSGGLQAGASRLRVEGAAVVVADRPRLRQIVLNLVRNAVEAAGPAGEVRVVIGASGPTVELAVSDSGAGLVPEATARLFEPFFTTKASGAGLGLAVSRAIARAHGGDIEVRSGDSGGAVFTLRLPRADEARDPR